MGLEINPQHAVVKQLKGAMETTPDSEETEDMVMMVYETAALIGGYSIEDPGDFARRVTKLMESTGGGGECSGDCVAVSRSESGRFGKVCGRTHEVDLACGRF